MGHEYGAREVKCLVHIFFSFWLDFQFSAVKVAGLWYIKVRSTWMSMEVSN